MAAPRSPACRAAPTRFAYGIRSWSTPRRPPGASSIRAQARRWSGAWRSSPRCASAARRRLAGAAPTSMRLRTLQSRIVVFFLVLLALVQGGALFLLQHANGRNARNNIRQELDVGERVFRRLSEQNTARLTQAVEILSLDFAFRQAVATLDLPTIQSVLLNHGARIQADKMALLSLDRKVLADTTDPRIAGRAFAYPALLKAAERDGRASGIIMQGNRAYQVSV